MAANRSVNGSIARNGAIIGNSLSSLKQFKSPLGESPQPKRKCRDEPKKENRCIAPTRPVQSMNAYEELVAKLLSRPFKVPIPDYVPDTHGNKCLGLRRTIVRRALHDPFACNALVLYTPPEEQTKLTQHSLLIQDKSKVLVHVVVDPVVGNILRPHQREGVKFMYDCVTGVKGEFQGCIMADEVNALYFFFHFQSILISSKHSYSNFDIFLLLPDGFGYDEYHFYFIYGDWGIKYSIEYTYKSFNILTNKIFFHFFPR